MFVTRPAQYPGNYLLFRVTALCCHLIKKKYVIRSKSNFVGNFREITDLWTVDYNFVFAFFVEI